MIDLFLRTDDNSQWDRKLILLIKQRDTPNNNNNNLQQAINSWPVIWR
jgi:hypothetical protein